MNVVMKPLRPIFLIIALAGLLAAGPALAQESSLIDGFGDWEAYREKDGGKLVCYIGSEPTKSKGKYKKRDESYVLITHRPAEKSTGVVSIKAGYTYKKDTEVEVSIGTSTFMLFTDGGHAFAYDAKADKALVKAMIRGAKMIIRGVSSRGTRTTDTYSLAGFTAAYKAIGKACKVK